MRNPSFSTFHNTMDASWKQALASYLDQTLRDSTAVKVTYADLVPTDNFCRSVVFVGCLSYNGSSPYSFHDAQADAAFNAYEALRGLSGECELRNLLGLSPRKHLREIDDIRDCIRRLKHRYASRFGHPFKDMALDHISKFYGPLEKLEKDLIECTGMAD